MTQGMLNVDRLEAASLDAASAGEPLALNLTWYVDKNVVMPLDLLRQLVRDAGMPDALIPEQVTDGQVLQRALRNLGDAGLVEIVAQTAERITYQFTARVRERAELEGAIDRLRYQQRYKLIWFRKEIPQGLEFLRMPGPYDIVAMTEDGQKLNDEAGQQLLSLINRYRSVYLPRDITRLMVDAISRRGAIQVNPKGHPYILPWAERDVVSQLRVVLAGITSQTGRDCKLRAFAMIDTPENRDEIGLAALDDLNADMDGLDYDLRERESARDVVRPETLDKLDERVRAVLDKAQVLMTIGDLRGVRFSALEERAADIRRRALDLRRAAEERGPVLRRGRGQRAQVADEPDGQPATDATDGATDAAPIRRGRRASADLVQTTVEEQIATVSARGSRRDAQN